MIWDYQVKESWIFKLYIRLSIISIFILKTLKKQISTYHAVIWIKDIFNIKNKSRHMIISWIRHFKDIFNIEGVAVGVATNAETMHDAAVVVAASLHTVQKSYNRYKTTKH